jgi:hypothetical protein
MKLICPNGHENPWESSLGWIWGKGALENVWNHKEQKDVNLSIFRKATSRILTGLELG